MAARDPDRRQSYSARTKKLADLRHEIDTILSVPPYDHRNRHIDLLLPPPSNEAWMRFHGRYDVSKMCTFHLLVSECTIPACHYDHRYVDAEIELCLRHSVREKQTCDKGRECRDDNCIYRHEDHPLPGRLKRGRETIEDRSLASGSQQQDKRRRYNSSAEALRLWSPASGHVAIRSPRQWFNGNVAGPATSESRRRSTPPDDRKGRLTPIQMGSAGEMYRSGRKSMPPGLQQLRDRFGPLPRNHNPADTRGRRLFAPLPDNSTPWTHSIPRFEDLDTNRTPLQHRRPGLPLDPRRQEAQRPVFPRRFVDDPARQLGEKPPESGPLDYGPPAVPPQHPTDVVTFAPLFDHNAATNTEANADEHLSDLIDFSSDTGVAEGGGVRVTPALPPAEIATAGLMDVDPDDNLEVARQVRELVDESDEDEVIWGRRM